MVVVVFGDEMAEIEIGVEELDVVDKVASQLDSCHTVVQFLTLFSSSCCLRSGGP